MKNLSNTFNMIDEESVQSYIGMNVIKYQNGTITTIQPVMINTILNSLGICNESKMYDTPASFILTKYEYGNGKKQE